MSLKNIKQISLTDGMVCAIMIEGKSVIRLYDVIALALCEDGKVRPMFMGKNSPEFCEDTGKCYYFPHYMATEDELSRDPVFANCKIYNFTKSSYGRILKRKQGGGFEILHKGVKDSKKGRIGKP